MNGKEKIQEWTGKRIDWFGNEYQIDAVFNEVRYLFTAEGRYPPPNAKITGQRTEDFGTVYYWVEERIEYNAIEVSYKCGHITVLTDEAMVDLNEGCVKGINDSVDGRTREEWEKHINTNPCPECRKQRIPEDGMISHLMPSDSPNAY